MNGLETALFTSRLQACLTPFPASWTPTRNICPPYSDKFGGADIYSSLRTPSGVAPLVVLNPENAALAAVKMLGLENPILSEKVYQFQLEKKKEVNTADNEVKGKKVSDLEN